MARSLKKGPFVDEKLMEKVRKGGIVVIKTWSCGKYAVSPCPAGRLLFGAKGD